MRQQSSLTQSAHSVRQVLTAYSGKEVAFHFVGLQSELAIKRIYERSLDFREALTFYQSLGFELSALIPNNAGHFPVLIEIDCIMGRKDILASYF